MKMKRKAIIILTTAAALTVAMVVLLIGCSQEIDAVEVFNAFAGTDNVAPVLISASTQSSSVVKLDFSEPVKVYGSSFGEYSARSDGKSIYISLPSSLEPGCRSEISGRVRDYAGNTCGFSVQVWGLNPRLPAVLINEFTTKGTEKSPDRTELRIMSDGNVNGMVLYSGIPDDWDGRVVFPDMEVRKGDNVVVWWTQDLPPSAEAYPSGLNICAASSDGLPSNNGTLVLCDTPSIGAGILDAVVYSNFSPSHQGYGTKSAEQRAVWVIESGQWKGDALDSTSSTATRSMSRNLDGRDSDSCGDWYITVTGGYTFGSDNTSEPY